MRHLVICLVCYVVFACCFFVCLCCYRCFVIIYCSCRCCANYCWRGVVYCEGYCCGAVHDIIVQVSAPGVVGMMAFSYVYCFAVLCSVIIDVLCFYGVCFCSCFFRSPAVSV